jgi:O-antigen/teichoic acid export membrane protein
LRKLRELFSDTLIYGISTVFARFINYLLVPFHTDVFNPARYGVVGLVYAAISMLNVLFTMGMESAYLRYAKNREEAAHIFKTLQASLLGIATLFSLLLWLAEPFLAPLMSLDEQTAGIYLMMIGILWFDTLSIVPFAELRLVRRAWTFAVLKTLHVVLNLFLNFYLILGLGFGIDAVFLSNLAASVVMTIGVWWATWPMMGGKWRRGWVSQAFSFGWPFVPAGIGYAINEMLDRFFLNAMDPARVIEIYGAGYTPEDIVGIYNACYKLAVFMLLLIQMYRMAWQPFFMRHSDDRDAGPLFANAFLYFNLFAASVYLFVGLFASEIVALRIPLLDATLIGSNYWMGLEIVPLLLLAYWFHGWYINFSAGIFISEKTGILPVITLVGASITVLANLVLVPLYGMMGSAWATVLSYGVMAVVLAIYSVRYFQVPYRLGVAAACMAVSVLIVLLPVPLSTLFETGELTMRLILFGAGLLLIILVAGNIKNPEQENLPPGS